MSDFSAANAESSSNFEIGADYFSIFSLASEYKLDLSDLKSSYLSLQQSIHPDRHAGADEQAQREAVQRAAYLNQAYETLKSPLKRAIYMLENSGIEFNADSQTHSDTAFLMSQLELRERLENIENSPDPFSELDQLMVATKKDYVSYQDEFRNHYSSSAWDSATQCINKMMFASKLLEEIRLKEELLDS